MKKQINVKDLGAAGDGLQDDTLPIQQALEEGKGGTVYIPSGSYRIVRTLLVSSDTEILAEPDARLFHCGSRPKKRGDFLLSNRHVREGDENITIRGGIWDGNFDGKNNTKCDDLFDANACSGATLNFIHVKNLTLTDLTVANSVVYFVRLCLIDQFRIEKIRFRAEQLSFNQDGLHFGGGCRNGLVEDIQAYGSETNDDLLALNADDNIVRLENLDLVCGDIENITFRNIVADNCYTAVRLLSVEHAIRNIRLKNIRCGCRMYAINMDAARYCRAPFFQEEDYPSGCGCIEDVTFENMTVFSTDDGTEDTGGTQSVVPLILGESRCRRFHIRHFCRDSAKEARPLTRPTLSVGNLVGAHIFLTDGDGCRETVLSRKQDRLLRTESFESLTIQCDGD